jgi:hypothetical protein
MGRFEMNKTEYTEFREALANLTAGMEAPTEVVYAMTQEIVSISFRCFADDAITVLEAALDHAIKNYEEPPCQ